MRLSELKIDPDFRDCLHRLTDEEYRQLEENILEYGIQSPLIIWRGYIVDGHNRYDIAFKNNIVDVPVREEYFSDKDDALEWILKNQLGRRNLSDFARNEIALRYKAVIARKAKENQSEGGKVGASKTNGVWPNGQKPTDPVNTREEIAKIAGTNDSSVKRTAYILKHGNDEEIERARQGGKGNSQWAIKREIKERTVPEGMKLCSKCNETKPDSDFYADSNTKSGLDYYCKSCRDKSNAESKKRKKEESREETDQIVAEMYGDDVKPYTTEMLIGEVKANSENFISLLRNMVSDRVELLDAATRRDLREVFKGIVTAVERIQEELL